MDKLSKQNGERDKGISRRAAIAGAIVSALGFGSRSVDAQQNGFEAMEGFEAITGSSGGDRFHNANRSILNAFAQAGISVPRDAMARPGAAGAIAVQNALPGQIVTTGGTVFFSELLNPQAMNEARKARFDRVKPIGAISTNMVLIKRRDASEVPLIIGSSAAGSPAHVARLVGNIGKLHKNLPPQLRYDKLVSSYETAVAVELRFQSGEVNAMFVPAEMLPGLVKKFDKTPFDVVMYLSREPVDQNLIAETGQPNAPVSIDSLINQDDNGIPPASREQLLSVATLLRTINAMDITTYVRVDEEAEKAKPGFAAAAALAYQRFFSSKGPVSIPGFDVPLKTLSGEELKQLTSEAERLAKGLAGYFIANNPGTR